MYNPKSEILGYNSSAGVLLGWAEIKKRTTRRYGPIGKSGFDEEELGRLAGSVGQRRERKLERARFKRKKGKIKKIFFLFS